VTVRIGERMVEAHLKLEGHPPGRSIKDRTARSLIGTLRRQGRLRRDSVVVESTSGNLGIGLARVCAENGLPFIAVVDPKVTPANLAAMRRLGALIEMVVEADDHGGFLAARLERVRDLCASIPELVWTDQYSNPANPLVHEEETGPEILRQTVGKVDGLFVAISTGGTAAGIARCLRRRAPRARVVLVDAVGSRAIGGTPANRLLTGIGSSRPSAFLTPDLYDDVVWTSDAQAFAYCRALAISMGLWLGGSSGAVLAACATYLAAHPEVQYPVCVCADAGDGYSETIYDDTWLDRNHVELHEDLLRPRADLPPSLTFGPAALVGVSRP
jgi:cysteine synthase A